MFNPVKRIEKSLYNLVEELWDLSYREGKLFEYKTDWAKADEERWEQVHYQVTQIKQEIIDRLHQLESNLEKLSRLLKDE